MTWMHPPRAHTGRAAEYDKKTAIFAFALQLTPTRAHHLDLRTHAQHVIRMYRGILQPTVSDDSLSREYVHGGVEAFVRMG